MSSLCTLVGRGYGVLALAVLLCTASRLAWADGGINVEKNRASPTAPGFSGAADLRVVFNQGNANLIDLGTSLRLAYLRGRHLAFVFGDVRFAANALARDGGDIGDLQSHDAIFIRRATGHGRHTISFTGPLAAEAFSQIQTDEFALLQSRFLLGTGPRLTLFENAEFSSYLGVAYMAEREALDPDHFLAQPGGYGRTNWWHRMSSYVSLQLRLDDKLSVQSATYVQPRLDLWTDIRIMHEASLEVPLGKHLGFKLSAYVRHDTRPPQFCTESVDEGACVIDNVRTLVATDVGVEQAFTVNF